MHKKFFLLLLIFTATSLFSMDIPEIEQFIVYPLYTKEAGSFLHELFDKKFNEIGTEFNQLSQRVKYNVLKASGDTTPLIMMGVRLSEDMQEEVALRLLDFDRKSTQLFCSLPLSESLNKYIKAEKQAHYYSKEYCGEYGFDLPIGFHYRTSDKTCTLLSKAIQSTTRDYFLTNEEMKCIYLLLDKEPWIVEKLGIKSHFLYRSIIMKEKITTTIESMQQIQARALTHDSLMIFFVGNGLWLINVPVFSLMGLIHMSNGGDIVKFFGEIAPTIVDYWVKPSTLCGLTYFVVNCLNHFVRNYYNNVGILLERKKTYI